jgi:uncharacterized protein YraI
MEMKMSKLFATAAVLAALTGVANAQPPCYVADPTGTPLNVRSLPNGSILGALHNGIRVNVVARRGDWVRIVATERDTGKSGWVYLDYLDCTL